MRKKIKIEKWKDSYAFRTGHIVKSIQLIPCINITRLINVWLYKNEFVICIGWLYWMVSFSIMYDRKNKG